MKNLYIIANWKANKTEEEAIIWLKVFKDRLEELKGEFEHKEVIICPSFPIIPRVKRYIDDNVLPLKVGSQDISQFGAGAYTGEVPTALIQKYIRYSIIGHSERRKNFKENDEVLKLKVSNTLSAMLLPIFCVQNDTAPIPEGVKIVAYEPIEAIGTGNPDTPENAERVAAAIKSKNQHVMYVLYGGSVDEENVNDFTKMEHIDGVLIGTASLSPETFFSVLKSC